MNSKKAPKADLQRYKSIFFLTGLCITLGICILIFNIKSTYKLDEEITQAPTEVVEQEMVQQTRQEEIKAPVAAAAPEAPKIVSRINIVHRDVNIDSDFDPFQTEFDSDAKVDVYNYVEPADVEEEEVAEEEIFIYVEEMPSFRGGTLDDFRTYVGKNTRYPEAAAEAGIQGRVQMAFVVERDGSVSNVQVLKGVDPLLDKEAIRVISSSPKWTPGKQRGKPARVQYTIPVLFFLHN